MPRAKKNGTAEERREAAEALARRCPYLLPDDPAWGGFVNIRMTEELTSEFRAWYPEQRAGLWSDVEDIVGQGMKLGLTFDPVNEAWVATFTGRGVKSSAARFVLTARAGTADEALGLLIFKHDVLAQGDWGDYQPSTQSFLKFG